MITIPPNNNWVQFCQPISSASRTQQHLLPLLSSFPISPIIISNITDHNHHHNNAMSFAKQPTSSASSTRHICRHHQISETNNMNWWWWWWYLKYLQDYSFEGADIPLNYLAPLMQLLVKTIWKNMRTNGDSMKLISSIF